MTAMTTPDLPVRAGSRRLPVQAVDTIEVVAGGFIGRKRITANDPFLAGHFPAVTVYPGVFLIESVHQMLELYLDGALGGIELTGVRSARFSRPALLGDELLFETAVTGERAEVTTDTTCVDADRRRYARISATWQSRP
jgi:3-hydroxyacyl-[acyl-carrier-protein] dehydratase